MLTIFTVSEAYLVSFICAFSQPIAVLEAAVLTAVVTIALTWFAFTTKIDVTEWGGAVMCYILMPVIMVQAVMGIFMQGNTMFTIIFSSIFACIYGYDFFCFLIGI